MSLPRSFAFLVPILGTALCLLLPATASAVTYCVGAGACAAGEGTPSANLATAFAAADNPTPDTIKIGPGTFELLTPLTGDANEPLTIVGAGTTATVLHMPDGTGLRGISLNDELSSISNLAIDTDDSVNNGVDNFLNTPLSIYSNVPGTGPQVRDVRIFGTGLRGLVARGDVDLLRVDIRLRHDFVDSNAGFETYSLPFTRQSVAPNVGYTRMLDSHVEGAIAMSVNDAGTFELQRSTVVYSWQGVSANANLVDLDVLLANDVFTFQSTPSPQGSTGAVVAQSGTGGTGSSDIDVFAWDSTFVTPVASNFALRGLAASDDVTRPASTSITANGIVFVGQFTTHVNMLSLPTNTGVAPVFGQLNLSRTVGKAPTSSPASGIIQGSTVSLVADPRFVDAAAGDYRPRWNSPLVDIGIAGRDPGQIPAWVGTTDRDGFARPVWSTASVAAQPKYDIGAYEYTRRAPVATAEASTTSPAAGTAVTLTGAATDANAGEAASLTYAWSLPGGATASTATTAIAAPTTPGTYQATLVATDVTGFASAPVTVTFTVPAPAPVVETPPAGTPPVVVAPPTVVAPADTTAPKVTFGKLGVSLSKLLKRTAVTAKYTLGEPATVATSLTATVTLPPLRKGAPRRSVVVVLATNKATKVAPGARSTKLTPTVAGLRRLAAVRALRGARVLRYDVQFVAADAAKNTTRTALRLTVTR